MRNLLFILTCAFALTFVSCSSADTQQQNVEVQDSTTMLMEENVTYKYVTSITPQMTEYEVIVSEQAQLKRDLVYTISFSDSSVEQLVGYCPFNMGDSLRVYN